MSTDEHGGGIETAHDDALEGVERERDEVKLEQTIDSEEIGVSR